MPRKVTRGEFIERASKVHNGKYDYSKAEYVNSDTKACIICKIHGEFYQTPHSHLEGQGCPKCGNKRKKKLISGIGINDSDEVIYLNRKNLPSYTHWCDMIHRCYDKKKIDGRPTYQDCFVCEDWKYYTNFKKWFEDPENGYKEGYHLDKDILGKGCKVYDPSTCCFVPQEINSLFTKRQRFRGNLPIGVTCCGSKYRTEVSMGGKQIHVGLYASKEEAFMAYKEEKEKHIREVASACFHNGEITKRVYNALMNYEVEITD